MPEGQSISYADGDYPEIDGLEDGAAVELRIKGHIEKGQQGGGSIVFDNVEINTEGMADRELSSMTKQQGTSMMNQPAMKKMEDM